MFIDKIIKKWKNYIKYKDYTPNEKRSLNELNYEEEALKRIKRINEIRAEVDKLNARAIKKAIPKTQEDTSETNDLKFLQQKAYKLSKLRK